jgi:hypothetical protein
MITDESPPLHGWSSLRAGARTVRANSGYLGNTHRAGAIADAEEAVSLEADPAVSGYAVARMTLGRVLQDAGEPEAAVEVLSAALRLPVVARAPGFLRLQAAGALASALLDMGRVARAHRVCLDVAAAADALEAQWGEAAGPVLTLLRTAEAGRRTPGATSEPRAPSSPGPSPWAACAAIPHTSFSPSPRSRRPTWRTGIPPPRP